MAASERPEEELALETPPPPASGESYSDLWRYRRSVLITVVAWLGASIAVSGLVLWGPTFLERILDISSDKAALLFLLVALGSFAGRLFFSFVPQRVGRRTCGLLMGFGAVPPLVLAAFSSDTEIAGVPLFLLALIPAAFFVDGGFANLAPYTPEIFPTSLRTHGMGLAWAVSGLGPDHRPARDRAGRGHRRPGRSRGDARRARASSCSWLSAPRRRCSW